MGNSLFLNPQESNDLINTLNSLESKNGTSMYITTAISDSYDCKNWDCFVSCNCANSRN